MSQSEELWVEYSSQGEPVGSLTRADAAAGALHAASHVWIWRKHVDAIEVLLQKRAADKRTWPAHYDISAAGHVDYGETPLEAAVRETQEEIGWHVGTGELSLIAVNRTCKESPDAGKGKTIENEFQYIYFLENQSQELHFADGEVDAVKWVTIDQLRDMISGKSDDLIVPHGEVYFLILLKELEGRNA